VAGLLQRVTLPETSIVPDPRPRSPFRCKAVLLVAAILVALFVYVWPARRNYYGKRRDVDFRFDIPYAGDQADPKRRLDLYLPRRSRPKPFPFVVFVHGGYWNALDRRWLQPLLGLHGNIGVAFANQGIGAAIIGYRQYPQIQRGEDSLGDIVAAIRFVRDSCPSWNCDPNHIFVAGHSAGGHLVSLLAMDERILRRNGVDPLGIAGFVSIDGIFDLGASLSYLKPDQGAVLRSLFGPDDATLAAHSTISYARPDHLPLLIVDSSGDERVCIEGFHKMKARMLEARSPAKFVELSGLGHNETAIRIGMDGDPVMPPLLEFIRTTDAAHARIE
jgi:acetyl esterase/lipase